MYRVHALGVPSADAVVRLAFLWLPSHNALTQIWRRVPPRRFDRYRPDVVDGPVGFNLNDHVHQAAGMVAAQSDCNIGEAFARMTLRADARGQTLEEFALDVLDRVVRFDS